MTSRSKHSRLSWALAALGLAVLASISCSRRTERDGSGGQPLLVHAPGSPLAIPGGNVVAGDMNNDGNPDFVVASARTVALFLGPVDRNPDRPVPGKPASITTVPEPPGELALGDVNGDGNLDLCIASHDSYGVTVLLGDGNGGLAIAARSPVAMKAGQHPHTHGLAVADLNGDGKPDLVTVNNADNDVSVMLGDGRGGFAPAPGSPYPVGPSPYPLALGDVDHDGRVDMVATASATGPARAQQLPLSRALTLLLADGRGGFRSTQLPIRTGEPWFVAIGDVNGDPKADLVATHHERRLLTVLLGDGSGGFAETTASPIDVGHDVFRIALADIDRDARPDVVAAAGDGVFVLLGDGRGGFRPAPSSPVLTGRGSWSLALSDFNRDGKVDVITSTPDSTSVFLGQ